MTKLFELVEYPRFDFLKCWNREKVRVMGILEDWAVKVEIAVTSSV